jgi:hypothetical protein
MGSHDNRSGRPFQLYLPDDLRAALEDVARGNSRTLAAEMRTALRLYLANPERVRLPEPPPKRPRGRPRKGDA